jgi:hypothetical protein
VMAESEEKVVQSVEVEIARNSVN